MNLFRTALCVAALVLPAMSTVVYAQTSYYEPLYTIPPACTGNNGKVFIGSQRPVIYVSTTSCDPSVTLDSLVAGNQLPSDLDAIWSLSMPDKKSQPGTIVGLVSYNSVGVTSGKRYGIIRSVDLGATWTVIHAPELADAAYPVSNSFYTQALGKMVWLNANNGWVYGNNGILRTQDGGLTWEQMYMASTPQEHVKNLVFRDANNGLAVMGTYPQGSQFGSWTYFSVTTDGGKTWESSNAIVAPRIITALQFVGTGYRAMVTDPFQNASNTYFYSSVDGFKWTNKWAPYIDREGGLMNEWLWTSNAHAFLILRSGEVWESKDTAKSWTNVQRADSVNYPMQSQSVGATKKGYGYSSFILDDTYIVQASTLKNTGELYMRMRWPVSGMAAGVDYTPVVSALTRSHMFPNPTSGATSIHLPFVSSAPSTLVVSDALGVQRKRVTFTTTQVVDSIVPVDLDALPNGTYQYSVTSGVQRATGSVTIVK